MLQEKMVVTGHQEEYQEGEVGMVSKDLFVLILVGFFLVVVK